MNARREISRGWGVVKSHGVPWVAARLALELQKRSGHEARAFAPRAWRADEWRHWLAPAAQTTLANEEALLATWRAGEGATWGRARVDSPAWRSALAETLDSSSRASLLQTAEDILRGRFVLFSDAAVDCGFPPAWQANPLTGGAAPGANARHWSRVPMRGDSFGDLKYVWELSRGSWAFTLARAYAATDDERFAEGFWALWLDWIASNPPNATVQWKCGQECSLRIIAVTFATQVFASAAATTPVRFARHVGAVAALADRVRRGGWYAQLQDNNHSMSEGAGAYTAAVTLPFLRDRTDWQDWGWQRLDREAERLIRPDGTFVQKSHNYHRLMLQVYLWAASLAAATSGGQQPSPVARDRLRAAAEYLNAVIDVESGDAPNFGANDGALILPLSEAPYTDFRATAAAAAANSALRGWREAAGPHAAETLLWLFGAAAGPARSGGAAGGKTSGDPPTGDGARAKGPDLALARGGIYTLHQERSWVFLHAESFADRPGQADQLHVDLWWQGLNLARDAGTYMYNGPAALYAWFRGTACHNTVTVDDLDQMEPGPRFMWASRAQARARVETRLDGGPGKTLRASHDGYLRLPQPATHERTVTNIGDDSWLVTDNLRSAGTHRYRLHWLLPDVPYRWDGADLLILETTRGPYYVQTVADAPAAVRRIHRAADAAPFWGWESRHYGRRTPALSLVLQAEAPNASFTTLFSPRRPARPLVPGVLPS